MYLPNIPIPSDGGAEAEREYMIEVLKFNLTKVLHTLEEQSERIDRLERRLENLE